jgi:hypothetical protein
MKKQTPRAHSPMTRLKKEVVWMIETTQIETTKPERHFILGRRQENRPWPWCSTLWRYCDMPFSKWKTFTHFPYNSTKSHKSQ